jgi:fructoselysine-6-P-deglycase FrlB-like protein
MIFKIFSPKKISKNWRFLTQNQAKLCKILIITLVCEKNANFFAENWQKSQKIVIITSTPDWPVTQSARLQIGENCGIFFYV